MNKTMLLLLAFLSPVAWGEVLRLDLASVERQTLAHSPKLIAAEETTRAAEFHAGAQRSRLSPVLALDGSYRHQSEVPSFKASPMGAPVELGDNANYSVGPAINWLAWDSGAVRGSANALGRQASARSEDVRATETQLRLAAQTQYFQVQGAAEQVRLLADGLRLAQAQRDDVRVRNRAGAASRQDLLQAETEVLARRREFREVQTGLAMGVRDLLALMGQGQTLDLARPLPEALATLRPDGVPAPTLVLSLPSPASLRAEFAPAADRPFDTARPELVSLRLEAEAARFAARAAKAGHGPSVQLLAKTSRDYPNGPIHEVITQNTYGAVARWPLFEGGRVSREVKEQEAVARSTDNRLRQTEENLRRDWQRARDRLAGLLEEADYERNSVQERTSLATVVYEAYRAGQTPFLEVQAANLGLLQSQVQSVITEVNILSQLALLRSLSTEVTP